MIQEITYKRITRTSKDSLYIYIYILWKQLIQLCIDFIVPYYSCLVWKVFELNSFRALLVVSALFSWIVRYRRLRTSTHATCCPIGRRSTRRLKPWPCYYGVFVYVWNIYITLIVVMLPRQLYLHIHYDMETILPFSYYTAAFPFSKFNVLGTQREPIHDTQISQKSP